MVRRVVMPHLGVAPCREPVGPREDPLLQYRCSLGPSSTYHARSYTKIFIGILVDPGDPAVRVLHMPPPHPVSIADCAMDISLDKGSTAL